MQEINTQNVKFLLNRLKSALNLTTDVELSSFLGISTQGISSWRSRNTIDYDLIFTKCGHLDLNWLIRGVPDPQNENDKFKNDEAPLDKSVRPQLRPQSDFNDTPLGEKKRLRDTEGQYLTGDKSIMNPGIGIPYYDTLPASAGDIYSFLNQAKPTSFIDLPQLTDCVAVLPVYGSSMKGVIEPGDLIAIKEVKTRDEFDPCVPYMVITEEHRMVKYLRVDENDQMVIWAESTNHAKIRLNADNIKMVYAIKCVIRFF